MDKTKLITTLYELSLLLYPRDVKDMVEEFIKNVMIRFGFSYAAIEIPLVNLKISLPKNFNDCPFNISFERRHFKIKFGRMKEIPPEYTKILEPLMDKLDQTLEFLILSELKRKLLENTEDVIILVDKNMIVREMNKKAMELLGDLKGKPIDRMWLNENVRLNGRQFSVSVYDLGFLRGIIAKDITEKVLLERELKEREKRLRTIVEIAPFAILVYKDWKYIYANKEAEKLLGYKKEEIIGKHVLDIFPFDYHEKIIDVIHKRLRDEALPPYVTKIIRKNGEIRYILVNGRKMKWGDDEAVVVAFIDITPQKLLEEDLSFLNSILRHDILNEITIVLNYLELYQEVGDKDFLEKIKESAKRVVGIINDVRDLEEIIKNSKYSQKKLKDSLFEVVKNFAHHNVEFRIKGDCTITVNEGGLKITVSNIIENALRHSGTDKIDIEIRGSEEFCEIRIADYGKGIPDDLKKKIFEKGFKYGESANTGLGLYIVKKIIERMGGEVWIEDNHPRGSLFVLRLRKS